MLHTKLPTAPVSIFVAFNLLKEFIKSNKFDIVLYCDKNFSRGDLKAALNSYFPKQQFDIIDNHSLFTSKQELYDRLKQLRTLAKQRHELAFKLIIQLLLLSLKGLLLCEKLFSNRRFIRCLNYQLFLSPIYKIPGRFASIQHIQKYVIHHNTATLALYYSKSGVKQDDWWWQLTDSLNAHDSYFTVSEYTRQNFLKYFPVIKPQHIHTVFLG